METEVLGQTVGQISELTHLVPIRPGYLSRDQYSGPIARPITYRLRLELLLSGLRKLEERYFPTPVRRLGVIHAARWAIVDVGTGEARRPHLLFATQYDGSWHDYIKQFSEEVWPMMDLIWQNCEGFDSARDFVSLSAFVRKYQITSDALYVDAPELTVGEVRRLQARRRHDLAQHVAGDEPSLEERALATELFKKLEPVYPAELFAEAQKRLLPWPIARPVEPPAREIVLADVQPHVVVPLDVDCAAMFFVRFASVDAARRVLARVHAAMSAPTAPVVGWNVGFSYAGLNLLQLSGNELSKLGPAFRAGMRERASWLGDHEADHRADTRDTHAMFTVYGKATNPDGVLSAGDAEKLGKALVDELAARGQNVGSDLLALLTKAHDRLAKAFEGEVGTLDVEVVDQHRSHRLLVVQQDGSARVYEYFGFEDGQVVQRQLDAVAHAADIRRALIVSEDPLLQNGTFLVVRKLEQDVEGFHRWAAQEPALAALMMGRARNGKPLGDVDFVGDPQGKTCPFQSHVRRANPRTQESRTREMVRRGMSYLEKGGQRGMLFLAFNRSLEDQFEFVQRNWIARGDASGGFREDVDPIVGRASSAARFEHHLGAERKAVSPSVNSFVSLRGGAYFFVPSRSTLLRLSHPAATTEPRVQPWQDTPSADCHAFWRARELDLDDPERSRDFWHRLSPGVHADSHAVFVAGAGHVRDVLGDDRAFSVREFGRRMKDCTGNFFLGMDRVDANGQVDGSEAETYRRQRRIADRIIPMANQRGRGDGPEEFAKHVATITKVARGVLLAQSKLDRGREVDGQPVAFFELDSKHFIAALLGQLTGLYFGIYDPIDYKLTTWSHHVALHVFGECPDTRCTARATAAGADFRSYVTELVRMVREETPEQAPLPKLRETVAAFTTLSDNGKNAFADDTQIADTLLGIVSGALATTASLFSQALSAYAREQETHTFSLPAEEPGKQLLQAMQRKALSVPERIYRVCRKDTVLHGTTTVIPAGALVVVGQGSALAEATGAPDDITYFGHGTHRCPAEPLALAIIEGAARALTSHGPLTRVNPDATVFHLPLSAPAH